MTQQDESGEIFALLTNYIDSPTKAADIADAVYRYVSKEYISKASVRETMYGLHEFIIGKDIIQKEDDQAFNYAILHKALDKYIGEEL